MDVVPITGGSPAARGCLAHRPLEEPGRTPAVPFLREIGGVDELLKKLNYKPPAPVTVLGAPPEARPLIERWAGEVDVHQQLATGERFVVAFMRSRAEVAEQAPVVVRALDDDAVLWMAYPKKSSKRYRSDLGRDDSWQPLGDLGYEAVRQVAVDADWSALRFRRAAQIARLARDPSRAMSAEGKRRAGRAAPGPPAVAEFLQTVPEARRDMVAAVDAVIRDAAPELEPALWQRMLGYGRYHYRYASGREGDSYVVALANQKQYVSLYLCGVVDGQYLAEANARRLGHVSVGKSCVRFKKLEDLDLGVVRELVRATADAVAHDSGT
jgi:hypothetical protein